jgi:hypothetical protein
MTKRTGLFLILTLSIGLALPAAASQDVSRVEVRMANSPAERAAQMLRSDKDHLISAAEAAILAESAAKKALAAAKAAKRAAEAARLAAESAVRSARAAKLALDTAKAAARRTRAPLPDRPMPATSKPKPATPAAKTTRRGAESELPAARAFRARSKARSKKRAAKTDAAKRRAAKPIERAARTMVLRVGPDKQYKTPSQAARAARNGDTIEIAAGVYEGDVAVWRADNLTLRGVGGRAHLKAAGKAARGKAIWVIRGDHTVVENIEFSGAKVRGKNGAGIRLEGTGLTIRNSYFHHNQMGLLTGTNPQSDVVIENSEFAYNIVDARRKRPLGHNIYIGAIRSFTLRNSYVHHATFGHNVKSRAATNHLAYNRLADEGDGNSSYIVDLPNGGAAYLVGNVIQQSRYTDNWSLINFGSKRNTPLDRLYLANNTLVSERKDSRFVSNRSSRPVMFVNNILVGRGKPARGPSQLFSNLMIQRTTPDAMARLNGTPRMRKARAPYSGNFTANRPGFVDIAGRDYRLSPYSPAIDIGRDPGAVEGVSLTPRFEFGNRIQLAERSRHGPLDLGAFEFIGD